MRKFVFAGLVAFALVLPSQAAAKIDALDPAQAGSPLTAAKAVALDPAQVTTASLPEYAFEAGPASPLGLGSSQAPSPTSVADFPTQGSTYAILSSGDVNQIASLLVNDEEGTSTDFANQQGALDVDRGEEANDWTVLKVDVNVPGSSNCLALDYRFLSEEFPEFVGSPFNDAFIAEVDSTSWSVGDDGALVRPIDFASSPAGAPISINGVGDTAVSPGEAAGTYFDAATGLITTKTPIAPGAHSIYLSIFDASDGIYDSAILLDNLRFISESAATCKPPTGQELAIPPTPPVAAPAPPPPSSVFTVGPSVKFKSNGTEATLTVTVPGPGTLSAASSSAGPTGVSGRRADAGISKVPSKKSAKPKKPLLVPASVHAAAAGPVSITVKLSGAGKAVLANKHGGKLVVPVRLTFTPDGGAPASQTKSVTFKKAKAKCGKGTSAKKCK